MNGFTTVAQEIEMARESVAILMNDECHNIVIDFGCTSFGTLYVKFSKVKVCGVVVHCPTEGGVEERERT